MPFLIPLTLQVSLATRRSMRPDDAASYRRRHGIQALATRLIERHGYRRVLVTNTFAVGVTMAAFALITPQRPL